MYKRNKEYALTTADLGISTSYDVYHENGTVSKDILGRSESNIVNTMVNKLKGVVRAHKIRT